VFSIKSFTKQFECDASKVKKALAKGLKSPQPRDRHSALDPQFGQDFLTWIQQHIEKNMPVTRTEILHHFAQ
jgi:hypothetical protein